MQTVDYSQIDIATFVEELLQMGMFACSAGFSQSAYDLFEKLHESFPDSEAPILAMAHAKLAIGEVEEAEDLLISKEKTLESVSEAIAIMKMIIALRKGNNGKANQIKNSTQFDGNEAFNDLADKVMEELGGGNKQQYGGMLGL